MSIGLARAKPRIVCVIGNSHVGALKRGWDRISRTRRNIELVFFCQRGMGLKGLNCEGSALVPDNDFLKRAIMFTSGGRDRIDVNEFDAIVLYALGANPFFRDESRFLSKKVIKQALHDSLTQSLAFELLIKIREISGKTVYIGHTPLPAAQMAAVNQATDSYIHGMQLANDAVYSPMNAIMMTQPLETIVNGGRTDIRYSIGSKRLAVGDPLDDEAHADDDVVHMNEEFGELWLNWLFSRLGLA